MRQLFSIASNTFMELVRQPVFLLLMTCSSGFVVFLSAVPYFGFGDDPKLVKDSALAVMLLSGLFGAILSATASISREVRIGTALAVLSKPVGRASFLLSKYVGIAGALFVLTYVNMLASLLASRMAFDAYGEADTGSLAIFFAALVVAYGVAGFSNYFLRRPFVSDAVLAVVVMTTLAFVGVAFFMRRELPMGDGFAEVDWRLLPAGVLILFALWILAGLAVACATRYDMVATLAICSGIFLLGLMSDFLFGRHAEPVWVGNLGAEVNNLVRSEDQRTLLRELQDRYDEDGNGRLSLEEEARVTATERTKLREAGLGGSWWASVLYTLFPNWQVFWLADALEGKNVIPWSYVAKASVYLVGYLGAALAVALMLFEDRELS